MNHRTINLSLLVVMLVSASFLGFSFYKDYSQALAEADFEKSLVADEVSKLVEGEKEDIKEVLDEIDFNVEEEVAVLGDSIEKPAAVQVANTLVVPSMSVNGVVYEGKSADTLDNGIWRIPGTSTPDKGGNTVLAAHRWKWGPQSGKSFYDIDKMNVGDQLTINWDGKDYTYQVSNITTVTPDKVDILKNTSESKLTLFSCAPLFSSKYRIVVEANLIS